MYSNADRQLRKDNYNWIVTYWLWLIKIGGLMGKKKKGDEETKPHGRWKGEGMIDWNWCFNGYEKKRWRDEGERELEIKACERETESGEVRWNCKWRENLMWHCLEERKNFLFASSFNLYKDW